MLCNVVMFIVCVYTYVFKMSLLVTVLSFFFFFFSFLQVVLNCLSAYRLPEQMVASSSSSSSSFLQGQEDKS